jgi:cysteinyl-tRNA synthetase
LKRAGYTEEQLQELIDQRTIARKNKQFDVSDGIRKKLAALGIALMDEPTGTMWRPCEPERSSLGVVINFVTGETSDGV